MTLLLLLNCFTVFSSLALAVAILVINAKAAINRVLAAYCGSLALWSLTVVFVQNPNTPQSTATLLIDVAAFGWCTFCVFFLWFVLLHTDNAKLLKRAWVRVSMALAPALFVYLQFSGALTRLVPGRQWYGWTTMWAEPSATTAYVLYYAVVMVVAMRLLVIHARVARCDLKVKQSRVILFGTITSLALGSATDIVLPSLGVLAVPQVAHVMSLILAAESSSRWSATS
jgi:hypothetical protein